MKSKRSLAHRAEQWRGSVLHQVVGKPTLGEVIDDAAERAQRPWHDAALELKHEWEAWLENDHQFPDEELLDAMGQILDLAGLTLDG